MLVNYYLFCLYAEVVCLLFFPYTYYIMYGLIVDVK